MFPGVGEPFSGANHQSSTEHFYSASSSRQNSEELANYKNSGDSPAANKSTADAAAADWKIVVPFTVPNNQPLSDSKPKSHRPKCLSPNVPDEMISGNVIGHQSVDSANDTDSGSDLSPEFVSGILPSARSRLASLKELGVKKIGALKMKLAENRVKGGGQEKGKDFVFELLEPYGLPVGILSERCKESGSAFAIMDPPVMIPEILTTPAGPFFIVQYVRNKNLLSAIHAYSDTLSVSIFTNSYNIYVFQMHDVFFIGIMKRI